MCVYIYVHTHTHTHIYTHYSVINKKLSNKNKKVHAPESDNLVQIVPPSMSCRS